MGTTYYAVERRACPQCGCDLGEGRKLTVGLSSAGWCFGLTVYPREYKLPTDLGEWYKFLKTRRVVDEYGRDLTREELMRVVLCRYRFDAPPHPPRWLDENGAALTALGLAYPLDTRFRSEAFDSYYHRPAEGEDLERARLLDPPASSCARAP